MFMINCRHCKKQLDGQKYQQLRQMAEKIKSQIQGVEAAVKAAADVSGAQQQRPNTEPLHAEVKAIEAQMASMTICDDCKRDEEKHAETHRVFAGIEEQLRNLSGGIGAVLDELKKVNANLEKQAKRKE